MNDAYQTGVNMALRAMGLVKEEEQTAMRNQLMQAQMQEMAVQNQLRQMQMKALEDETKRKGTLEANLQEVGGLLTPTPRTMIPQQRPFEEGGVAQFQGGSVTPENRARAEGILAKSFPAEYMSHMIQKGKEKYMGIPAGGLLNIETGERIASEPKPITNKIELTHQALKEELGREPSATELKARILKEAKGYDTEKEAMDVAIRMVKAAGSDAGLVPSFSLSTENKYIPETKPNIELRIPPGVPNFQTGIDYDKRRKEYSITTPQGKVILNSEQVKDLSLQAGEQRPTETTKVMQQFAPKVLDLATQVKKSLNEEVQRLGPATSRWRDFWAGKVGSPDPEFTKLQTNVGLLSTLLLRMHVGARGGIEMMQHFKEMMDAGKQSPENMNAAVDAIIDYAGHVKEPIIKSPMNKTEQPIATHQYIRGKGIVPMGGK